MPWKEVTRMTERKGFIQEIAKMPANFSRLCQVYGVSRKTGYKWVRRYREEGWNGLADRSRRPHAHPRETDAEKEALILRTRAQYPGWGGRKIKRWLEERDYVQIPSPSTITEILRRNDALDLEECQKHAPTKRFQMESPNDLWQMDFKGRVWTQDSEFCYPLVILDDASRYLLALEACQNQNQATIQRVLTGVFRSYGLPERMLMDNGVSWSGTARKRDFTHLSIWLIRLGIFVSHGRARHPQTQGKVERLNRSLDQEVLNHVTPADIIDAQHVFDHWFYVYNQERPHEALDMQVPAVRYKASFKQFPEQLPPVAYPSDAIIRKVDISGRLYYRNRRFRIGKALAHMYVQVLPTDVDGDYQVNFLHQPIAYFSLRCKNDD
jgi:transposase InsO family protein